MSRIGPVTAISAPQSLYPVNTLHRSRFVFAVIFGSNGNSYTIYVVWYEDMYIYSSLFGREK
jgi:hypothetical protein